MDNRKDKHFFTTSNDEFSPSHQNGHHYPGFDGAEYEPEILGEEIGLTDELDHEILLQRDAHFGGDFGVMIEYYDKEGVGMHPDIELERIEDLAQIEKEIGTDLAPLVLSGSEAEKIARSRKAYEKFKEIYLTEKEKTPIPRLIADLVLSEEEDPQGEIEAVVAQGTKIVPELIALIESDDAYDSLFPGYGYAPYFAAICLGRIGDPRAIRPLFEMIGRETVFDEQVIIEALADIGDEAQKFLIKVVEGRPVTQDNAHAALALNIFAEDPNIAVVAFKQLQDPEVQKSNILCSYLIYCCENINHTAYKDEFIQMTENQRLPASMRREMKEILRDWQKAKD